MIWLTWRQFRGQAIAALAALAVLATYLTYLGVRIQNAYDANVECGAGCSLSTARDALEREFITAIGVTGLLVTIVPAILGAFWGAPLIAREIETGTHRLVWNQSVTRVRWLSVKLAFVILAGVVVAGASSLLLTWAAGPYDKLIGQRFEALTFPARNITPIGYAVFAVVLGTTVGLVARRTIPAMAITLAVFVGLQILMPTVIRPHLQTPITETRQFEETVGQVGISLNDDGSVTLEGYSIPGAWMLDSSVPLHDADGKPVTDELIRSCFTGSLEDDMACLAGKNLHFTVSYHPGDRYWTFQLLETMVCLVLAGMLAAFAFWRIPRGVN